MRNCIARLFALSILGLGLGLSATSVAATRMRLDATSLNPDVTSFFVVFDDAGDGLFELPELTTFSGVTLFGTDSFSLLNSVPKVSGFAAQSGPSDWCAFQGTAFPCWGFSSPGVSGGGGSAPENFSYALTSVAVPEAATRIAMLIGLLGLGALKPCARSSRG
ncbi:MAG: hypothetical protein IV092_26670 [Burkholderiaceae bacterium]|nr:hypothetical protein [Burkholderiaceae bacterium]